MIKYNFVALLILLEYLLSTPVPLFLQDPSVNLISRVETGHSNLNWNQSVKTLT